MDEDDSGEIEFDEVQGTKYGLFLRQNGPDHLGLWHNALPEHQMALTTSDCGTMRAPSTNLP